MKRFLVAGLVLLWWAVMANAAEPESSSGEAENFHQLDAEVEQTLLEVVNLGAEMAVLKESRDTPEQTQLMILVSVDPASEFTFQTAHLMIDGREVMLHQYTAAELQALANGGSQRLYWGQSPAGRRQISVALQGRLPRNPEYQQQVSHTYISGAGRHVLQLSVAAASGKDKQKGVPVVTLQEWK